MKVTKVCLIILASLTLAVSQGHAQTDSTATTNKPPTAVTRPKAKQMSGKIASVDMDAKTISLEGPTKREIKITSKTKIYNNGDPATLADATVGSHVAARLRQDADGNWVATTLRIGEPKHRTPAAASTNSPAATPPPQ
jgi:hypothetical protein